jgi:hypothetical protein
MGVCLHVRTTVFVTLCPATWNYFSCTTEEKSRSEILASKSSKEFCTPNTFMATHGVHHSGTPIPTFTGATFLFITVVLPSPHLLGSHLCSSQWYSHPHIYWGHISVPSQWYSHPHIYWGHISVHHSGPPIPTFTGVTFLFVTVVLPSPHLLGSHFCSSQWYSHPHIYWGHISVHHSGTPIPTFTGVTFLFITVVLPSPHLLGSHIFLRTRLGPPSLLQNGYRVFSRR